MHASHRIGLLAAVTAATAYGANIVGARLASDAGIEAPLLIFYRVLLMALLVGTIAVLWRKSLRIAAGEWPIFAILVPTTAGMGLCYLSAVAFVPVTVAAVIFYTYPVMIVLVAPFVTGERMQPLYLGAACLAFLGIAAVVGPSFDRLDWRGLVLAFLAAALTVVQFFAANRAHKTSTLAKIFSIQIGIIPIAFAVAQFGGSFAGPDIAARAPFGVALATIGYLIGFGGQMLALTHLRASLAGLVFCLEPVVAAIVSALVLGERLNIVQYAGGALVIVAIAMTVLASEKRKKGP